MNKLITIEIWSDIVCPFCYIGKRKFENALQNFEHRDEVEIIWKSYQLNPNIKSDPNKHINEYLAEAKNVPLEEAAQINKYVENLAKNVNLFYDFEGMKVANTMKAHRLLHYAKSVGKQNELKELLFKSYFTDGRNVDDTKELLELASSVELDSREVQAVLDSNMYEDAVKADIEEGKQLGLTGVPFFVINKKYAISGAQESSTFLESLEKVYRDSKIQMARTK